MNAKKKKYNKILILLLTCLIVFTTLPLNVNSAEASENKNELSSGMKTIYMKADCQKIIFVRPVNKICIPHIGPFWHMTKYAYLAFLIDKEFTLKINGQSQNVNLPTCIIPYNFIGLGPLFFIKNKINPCDGNITLIGFCEDVIIHSF